MVSLTNTFAGGTPGVAVTVANLTATGDAPASVAISSPDQITFSNYDSRQCLEFALAGPGAGATRILWNAAEAGRLVVGVRIPNLVDLPTNIEDFLGIRHASGNMAVVQIQNLKLQVANAAGATITASRAPEAFPAVAGHSVWLEVEIQKGTTTSNGLVGYRYYVDDSSTIEYSWTSSAQNTGTANVAQVFLGRSTGRTDARTYHLDTFRVESLTAGNWIGQTSAPVPAPTANAGPDLTSIEPFRTVTIDGTGSVAAAGHGITAYELTRLSGPAVTVTGTGPTWTYAAPAGWDPSTIVWQVRVQDDLGVWSTTDTASHSFLHATNFIAGVSAHTPVRKLRA